MKNTYWLIGPDNTFAQVDGAAARDKAAEEGWTATDEPTGADRVWLQHNVTGAISLFPYAALAPWQAVGWEPVLPPTQDTDQGRLVVLPERAEQTQSAIAETPAVTPPPADKPNTDKEQSSGR